MCFGFPSRTTKTTTESETMPRCAFAAQFFGTSPLRTSVSTSGSSESATRSAGCPAATARAWSPEAPYDWLKLVPFPAPVFWKAEMILPYASFGVEYATRSTEPPFVAPVAEPASSKTPIKEIHMSFIDAPYLPSLSTELLEIVRSFWRRQIGSAPPLEWRAWNPLTERR